MEKGLSERDEILSVYGQAKHEAERALAELSARAKIEELEREIEITRHHPDNCERLAIQLHRRSDNSMIAIELPLPKIITEEDDGRLADLLHEDEGGYQDERSQHRSNSYGVPTQESKR